MPAGVEIVIGWPEANDSGSRGSRFWSATSEFGQRAIEGAQVEVDERGRDIEASRELGCPVDDTGEPADDDVVDPVRLERLEERVRVERTSVRSPLAAEPVEERLNALLRRLLDASPEFGVKRGVVDTLDLLQPERVPACLDGREDVLEARFLPADLPSCDLGSVAAKELRELRLRQPRLHPRFADRLSPCHDVRV